MHRKNWIGFIFLLLITFIGTQVYALSLGTNITIPDRTGTGSGWGGAQEDQEVEPGCTQNQSWDLEGFYLKNNVLSMVGGYDFKNGQAGYTSGHIFIDTNRNAQYGTDISGANSDGQQEVTNSFGYEYALVLNFTDGPNGSYNIIALDGLSLVNTGY